MKFFKKIYNDYFSLKLSDFKGFDSDLQINKLLFFVFLGLIVACIIINLNNSSVTLILKKLTRTEAFGEDKSKKLSELGLGSSRAVKRVLTHKGGATKHLIALKGFVPLTFEEYTELENSKKRLRGLKKSERREKLDEINKKLYPTVNFNEAEFYIPEDMKDAAQRFISEKSTTPLRGLIYCFGLLVFYAAVMFLMPTLLTWIGKLI